MKIAIKLILASALFLSFSSIYAQTETQTANSKSNIRSNKIEHSGDPHEYLDSKKPQVIETEEGWNFINITLTDEQKTALRGLPPAAFVPRPLKLKNLDDLLNSGTFSVLRDKVNDTQKEIVLKTKHDTTKNSINNIR